MQTSHVQSLETVAATLLTGYIVKKLQLDNIYYGFAYTLVVSGCVYIMNYGNLNFICDHFAWLLPIVWVLPIVALIYAGWQFRSKFKLNQHTHIYIYSKETLQKVIDYMNMYPKIFGSDGDISAGDKDLQFQHLLRRQTEFLDQVCHVEDKKIPFVDYNFNIKGYICWRKESKDITKVEEKDKGEKQSICLKYLEIGIDMTNHEVIDTKKILQDILSHVREKQSSQVRLVYVKVLDKASMNHTVVMYEGEKQEFKTKERLYMHTFFHQERDRLWSVIKKIHLDPEFFTHNGQGARISLLLHGPPGCGKSTYVYRIAMCLDRHIVSLDLRNHTKGQLYQIIQRPAIEGVTDDVSHKKCVLMFDEFDISIIELHSRTLKYKDIDELWMKRINSNESDEVFKEGANPVIKETLFTLRDLLEVFQGPVPLHGSVLLATTNRYDEIHQLCPELFRPGRLTPVHFGYITKEVLQNISKHYFGQRLGFYLSDFIKVPTSQIIELALESKLQESSFDYFSKRLETLL